MNPLQQYGRIIAAVLIGLFIIYVSRSVESYGHDEYVRGRGDVQALWDAEKLQQSKKLVTQMTQSTTATNIVVTKYIDRVKQVAVKGDTIIKEVPIYVTKADDAHCRIPTGFGVLWNEANGASPDVRVSDPTARTHDTAQWLSDLSAEAQDSGLSLSDVATQHVVEAQYTLDLEERLQALQEWVHKQRVIIETTQ